MNVITNFDEFSNINEAKGEANTELANIRSIKRAAQYLEEIFMNEPAPPEWIKDHVAKCQAFLHEAHQWYVNRPAVRVDESMDYGEEVERFYDKFKKGDTITTVHGKTGEILDIKQEQGKYPHMVVSMEDGSKKNIQPIETKEFSEMGVSAKAVEREMHKAPKPKLRMEDWMDADGNYDLPN